VFRELVDSRVIEQFPNPNALRARCEARPAFSRALEAQLAVFRAHAPAPG
jgi:glutathione S-transferase